MPRRTRFFILLTVSFLCLLLAGWLTYTRAGEYNINLDLLPTGTTIAGIQVGGLTRSEAGARVVQAYALTPVELLLNGKPVQIDPVAAGQKLDLAGMLGQADQVLAGRSYWKGFWDFLWNRTPAGFEIGLLCNVDENELRTYLSELLERRYNQPPSQAIPQPGDPSFQPGQPGETLNIETALPEIRQALCSRSSRSVAIGSSLNPPFPPTLEQLRLVLESLIQVSGFDGIIELYFEDLQTGESFNLATANGRSVEPGISFTAASTIKIPVMISVFRKIDGELPADLQQQMALMIDLSDNSSTDEVMQRVLDTNLAPVQVSEDAQILGLENTFLAGFFYPGAPLLSMYKTPGNQRSDISTDPDIYNQTSPADMGRLLAGIHQCAANNNGPLIESFPNQITQAECQQMVNLLAQNRKGVLIEAGLPEGTWIGHKYGWVTDPADGLMHQASDAALVRTPGGDFVLTVYLSQADQLQWDPAQRLVAQLSTAIFNYYNQLQ